MLKKKQVDFRGKGGEWSTHVNKVPTPQGGEGGSFPLLTQSKIPAF